MNELMNSMREVYSHLADEESKKLFENKVMYALTSDYKYVMRMFENIPEKSELDKVIAGCKTLTGDVVYYGAGNDLKLLLRLYPELELKCLCDRDVNKQKNGYNGIPVISPEQLLERKDNIHVVIVTTGFHKEIKQYLLDGELQENQITDLGAVLEPLYNRQYFDDSVMSPMKEGVFIDGGCYDCSTSMLFSEWCDNKYEKIFAFEPDEQNFTRCKKKREQIPNMEILNKGLWDCDEELTFAADCGQGSKITNQAENTIRIFTTSIDKVVKDEKVTLIKLDVEGAELKALQGARNTILRDRPRLAVSIYHKPEDIFEIPSYILSLHKDYKLYMRHYQFSEHETILYAI